MKKGIGGGEPTWNAEREDRAHLSIQLDVPFDSWSETLDRFPSRAPVCRFANASLSANEKDKRLNRWSNEDG